VLYEGCDSDGSAAGDSSDMTVDEALAALAVLPGWGRSDLAATVADGFVASLDTQVEACLATLNRLEQLSLVAARPAGPKDASSNADENIAAAATAEIQPVLDHCVSVATFMIRAAIGAVSVPALFGLCGEEITAANDESESRQPSVAIVQATPAEQIRSQAGELMIRLSAKPAAQPSQSGKDWLQSPQLFIDAAVDLAPQWVLRRAVTDAAIDAHGRRPQPVKMEEDDDDSISADSSGRISMLGLLVLLRKCHSTVQRHLFAATAAIQEASPADVELLAVSDCVTAFAPFIDEVPPAFAVPVFAIASLVMQRGGPAVAMASRLARICLLAASTEPSSFSASWIQRVAEAQRSVLAVASGEAVSPPSFKRHRKEEPALVVSDTTTSGTSSSGGATLEASRHAGGNRTATTRRAAPAALSAALATAPLFPESAPADAADTPTEAPSLHHSATVVSSLLERVTAARRTSADEVSDLASRVNKEVGDLKQKLFAAAKDVAASYGKLRALQDDAVRWQRETAVMLSTGHAEIATASRAFTAALEGLYTFEDAVAGSVLPDLRRRQDDLFMGLKEHLEHEFRALDREYIAAGHESPLRLLTAALQGAAAAAGGGASSISAMHRGPAATTAPSFASATTLGTEAMGRLNAVRDSRTSE
jgi:hypothetical protein